MHKKESSVDCGVPLGFMDAVIFDYRERNKKKREIIKIAIDGLQCCKEDTVIASVLRDLKKIDRLCRRPLLDKSK